MSNTRRVKWRNPCLDCKQPTWQARQKSEWYMVHDHIWAEASAPTRDVMTAGTSGYYLCIGCLEGRLGRQLTAADFPDYPVNEVQAYNTDRLNDRLNATGMEAT